mmetsp:Transcript_145961/g.467973  ORF Transcript_145961/g.467973 Transcript_145961/m.467973 type:complete len:280 (+) Transcript_145961:266-1105(+)
MQGQLRKQPHDGQLRLCLVVPARSFHHGRGRGRRGPLRGDEPTSQHGDDVLEERLLGVIPRYGWPNGIGNAPSTPRVKCEHLSQPRDRAPRGQTPAMGVVAPQLTEEGEREGDAGQAACRLEEHPKQEPDRVVDHDAAPHRHLFTCCRAARPPVRRRRGRRADRASECRTQFRHCVVEGSAPIRAGRVALLRDAWQGLLQHQPQLLPVARHTCQDDVGGVGAVAALAAVLVGARAGFDGSPRGEHAAQHHRRRGRWHEGPRENVERKDVVTQSPPPGAE